MMSLPRGTFHIREKGKVILDLWYCSGRNFDFSLLVQCEAQCSESPISTMEAMTFIPILRLVRASSPVSGTKIILSLNLSRWPCRRTPSCAARHTADKTYEEQRDPYFQAANQLRNREHRIYRLEFCWWIGGACWRSRRCRRNSFSHSHHSV